MGEVDGQHAISLQRFTQAADGSEEEARNMGFVRLGQYSRLYRALIRAKRTPPDLEEIFQALELILDPAVRRLEEPVKRAMCKRIRLEEFEPNIPIFKLGDDGDRLFILWSGTVQLQVPLEHDEVAADGSPPQLVEHATVEAGQEAGELGLFIPIEKRKSCLVATQQTQILSLTVEDYRWCTRFSQESFMPGRVGFLRMADRATLGEESEAELQAMAAWLREEQYMGPKVVLKQGTEVDKLIFVKSGLCKVIRQCHPRYRRVYERYGSGPPPPNPLAPTEGVSTGAPKTDQRPASSYPGSQELQRLLQRHGKAATRFVDEAPTQDVAPAGASLMGRSRTTQQSWRASNSSPLQVVSARRAQSVSDHLLHGGAVPNGAVVVDVLHAGQSYGIVELMEGLSFQNSVVPDPWVEVYEITKDDLLRHTSKDILHTMFLDYKARLTDDRLMHRLKQMHRWKTYKQDMLDDIRSRRSRPSRILTRGEPLLRLGTGDLRQEDYQRVGNGERLWDERATTPPREKFGAKARPLVAGARVQLTGLKRHPELNGMHGTVIEQCEDSRWQVLLDNESTRAFKAVHLEQTADDVQHTFRVWCERDAETNAVTLQVDWKRRDASMATLDERIHAAARSRDRRRGRSQDVPQVPGKSQVGAVSHRIPLTAR
mmetsp:Transcript_124226/g.247526  ORF Transcript_124226/g.247526 Transcript_124226/m.247526 type:complete len:657 (-) Transcript_124226:13-1983(-)